MIIVRPCQTSNKFVKVHQDYNKEIREHIYNQVIEYAQNEEETFLLNV